MSLEQSSATTDEASTQQISAEGVAAPAAEPAAVNPVVASDGHRRKTVLAIDADPCAAIRFILQRACHSPFVVVVGNRFHAVARFLGLFVILPLCENSSA